MAMRIIKPYGRSIVEKPTGSEEYQRKITPKTNDEKNPASQELETFLNDNPNFFIAQWASLLDKMINKPAPKKQPDTMTYQARDKAGHAFFQYWLDKKLLPGSLRNDEQALASFKHDWFKRVHPYGQRNIKEKWYQVFAGEQKVTECDWQEVAGHLDTHLYKRQKKFTGGEYPDGLIHNRARSIKHNARRYQQHGSDKLKALSAREQTILEALQQTTEPDWEHLKNTYQLSKLATALKQAENTAKSKKKRLRRTQAMPLLHQHYGRIFTKENDDGQPSVLKISEAKTQQPELWRYHKMIEEALRSRYQKHYSGEQNQKPVYTLDEESLHQLALATAKNRQLAFLVRLGKVLHYEAGATSDDSSLGSGIAALDKDITQLIQSDYWSSNKQTLIKQNESFVRQWMAAISIANNTLHHLLDPENKVQGDLLTQRPFNNMLANFDQQSFNQQFKLLFGADHELFDTNDVDQAKQFITNLRDTLEQLRHASFHFKSIEVFNQQLEKSASNDKITQYINDHKQSLKQQYIDDLKAFEVENYLNQAQLETLWEEINQSNQSNDSMLLLPKFNRLLKRAQNIQQLPEKEQENDKKHWLIRPANDTRTQQSMAFACAFGCLKRLYHHGFTDWLEEQDSETINHWISQAKQRATKAARKLQRDNSLLSRMESLRPMQNDENLANYFNYLVSETASEFQVQQGRYQSNPENARKQSNFIDDFKLDILIYAFPHYLEAKNLKLLLDGNQLNKTDSPCNPDQLTPTTPPDITYPWLYLLLHLMPAEFINHLSMQLRKHHSITGGSTAYQPVSQVIDLYLAVRNHVLDTRALSRQTRLSGFWQDTGKFALQFSQSAQQNQLIPIRGLRELERFGNLEQLLKLFDQHKVSNKDVDELITLKESIAEKQKTRTELHQECQNWKQINKKTLQKYRDALNSIITYREHKNRVYLHHPRLVHQLILAMLGRLAGYSQLWERDLYFVILGYSLLRDIEANDFSDRAKDCFKSGQVVNAFRAMKNHKKITGNSAAVEQLHDALETEQALFWVPESKIRTRNKLAHLNALHGNNTINLTTLINETRGLMAYDRKLKNAISRSVIELLERYGFTIRFNMNREHKLYCKSVQAKTISHLAGKGIKPAIEESLHPEQLCQVVETLFGCKTRQSQQGHKKHHKKNGNKKKQPQTTQAKPQAKRKQTKNTRYPFRRTTTGKGKKKSENR